MKKILSVLMILVLVGGVAFAQIEPVVEGSAALEWGVDFGAGSQTDYKGGNDNHAIATHGFKNSSSVAISIPLFTDAKSFSGGSANKEADVYVTFGIANVVLTAGELDASPNASAALHFYGAYMTVYPKPGFTATKASTWKSINGKAKTDWFAPTFTGFGTKIGYKPKDMMGLDVAIKLASNGSWDQVGSDGVNKGRREKDSRYAFGLDFAMQPVEKYLGVSATVNATLGRLYDLNKKDGPGDYGYNAGIKPDNAGGEKKEDGMVNFGVAFTSEPIADMKITLGFDGATGLKYTDEGKTKATFGWDMGLGLAYKWVDAAVYVAGTATPRDGWNLAGDDPTKRKDYGMNMAAHLGFVSNDKEGDPTNFVKGLGLNATVNVYNLLVKNMTVSEDSDRRKAYIEALNGVDPHGLNPSVEQLLKTKYASMPIGLNVGASYKYEISDVMWVKPFAQFYGETNHYKQHPDTYASDNDKRIDKPYFGMAYNLGVEFQPIEKVVVSATWNHGKLNNKTYEGGFAGEYMIDKPINYKNHNGTFVLGLKLTY